MAHRIGLQDEMDAGGVNWERQLDDWFEAEIEAAKPRICSCWRRHADVL